jgi:hypothetical protein
MAEGSVTLETVGGMYCKLLQLRISTINETGYTWARISRIGRASGVRRSGTALLVDNQVLRAGMSIDLLERTSCSLTMTQHALACRPEAATRAIHNPRPPAERRKN